MRVIRNLRGLIGFTFLVSLTYGFIYDFCSVMDHFGLLYGAPENMTPYNWAGVVLTVVAIATGLMLRPAFAEGEVIDTIAA